MKKIDQKIIIGIQEDVERKIACNPEGKIQGSLSSRARHEYSRMSFAADASRDTMIKWAEQAYEESLACTIYYKRTLEQLKIK